MSFLPLPVTSTRERDSRNPGSNQGRQNSEAHIAHAQKQLDMHPPLQTFSEIAQVFYLRQVGTLHLRLRSSLLGHDLPPFLGFCTTVLRLYRNAVFPQVCEHTDHSVHWVTSQSTASSSWTTSFVVLGLCAMSGFENSWLLGVCFTTWYTGAPCIIELSSASMQCVKKWFINQWLVFFVVMFDHKCRIQSKSSKHERSSQIRMPKWFAFLRTMSVIQNQKIFRIPKCHTWIATIDFMRARQSVFV